MGKTPHIDQLREHAEKLLGLLTEPEPGLFTWNRFVHEQLMEIADFLDEESLRNLAGKKRRQET